MGLVRSSQCRTNPNQVLQLVNLEQRGEGGRAYKVVTPEGYLVDLREDVVFDVLMSTGSKKGGLLKGKFLWGKNTSQMRIIQVGSELHKEFVEGTKLRQCKRV